MPPGGRSLRVPGIVLLLVVVAAASPLDELAHDLVFRYLVSHEVRLVANGVTFLGTTTAGIGLLGALALVGYRVGDAVLWRGGVGGLAGLAVAGAAGQVVKHVACRARPRLVAGWGVGDPGPTGDPARRGFFHWPCLARWRYHSFPSGHANTAFTTTAALIAVAPARRRAWLLVAAGVAASRVLLNAHFVSDVLAGGLIGWWGGQAGLRLADRWLPRLPALRTVPPGPPPAEEGPPLTTPGERTQSRLG